MHNVVLVSLLAIALAQDTVVVNTQSGKLRGLQFEDYSVFLGVPYAEAPVGKLRWAPTVPIAPWNGIRNATVGSAGCPQDCILPPHTCPASTSEDCLYINIWVPASARATSVGVPVLFFIPGGRFEQGAGDSLLYSGTKIVQSGIILVTINYRLGALGYLVYDEILGNFGIQDQRAALQWINDNIAAFGGNPSQITIAGQSAGGASTVAHLVSPLSYGLYSRAIVQSDPLALPMIEQSIAREIGARFVSDLGCGTIGLPCLMNANVSDILAAQKEAGSHIDFPSDILDIFMPWTPNVNGDDFPTAPLVAFTSGNFNKVPLMIGTVLNEAYLFVFQADTTHPIDDIEYDAILGAIFDVDALDVYDMYPPTSSTDNRPSLAQIGTEVHTHARTHARTHTLRAFACADIVRVFVRLPGAFGCALCCSVCACLLVSVRSPDFIRCVGS
jgi:carboxylesterase type B